jgi:hypothetical protein
MNIEIIENGQIKDFSNISLKDYKEEISAKMDIFSRYELDFSCFNDLKGDKSILNISFLNQIAEELNL